MNLIAILKSLFFPAGPSFNYLVQTIYTRSIFPKDLSLSHYIPVSKGFLCNRYALPIQNRTSTPTAKWFAVTG